MATRRTQPIVAMSQQLFEVLMLQVICANEKFNSAKLECLLLPSRAFEPSLTWFVHRKTSELKFFIATLQYRVPD